MNRDGHLRPAVGAVRAGAPEPTGASDSRYSESAVMMSRGSGPEEIFNLNYDRLVNALTVVAGNREVAADAVQEAFVRLVASWNRLSKYDDPAGWVRRVAVNQILDHKRYLLRRARAIVCMKTEAGDASQSFSEWSIPAEVKGLPTKQRVAVALYYVADLSVSEIARIMGISDGSVNQHLFRARRALRAAWGNDGES